MNNKNIFKGKNGLKDFLNPYNTVTPLVEIPNNLNPFRKDGINIFLKLQYFLPLMNSKSVTSFGMMEEFFTKKKKCIPKKIVESSSGNTAISLSVLSKNIGVKQTLAYVSDQVTTGKLQLLKLFGINIIVNRENICPNPNDMTSGIIKAKKLGTKPGIFNAGQYDNENNPDIHYKLTGPQIYNQLDGNIQIFTAGLGTTGTFLGTSRYLKEKNKNIVCLGVVRKPNNPIPGPRTESLLQQIAFPWESCIDHMEYIGTKESYELSLSFIRHGFLIGPSSGMALSGLFSYLSSLKNKNKLGHILGKSKQINAVVICPDSFSSYVEEYFKYVDESSFPEIKNQSLLNEKNIPISNSDYSTSLSVNEAYKLIYRDKFGINMNEIPKCKKNVIIFDLRSKSEYDHFHLHDSLRIDSGEIEMSYFDKYKGTHSLCFVCSYGKKSNYFSLLCKKKGIKAYSIKGGTIEWSAMDYPRFLGCKI